MKRITLIVAATLMSAQALAGKPETPASNHHNTEASAQAAAAALSHAEGGSSNVEVEAGVVSDIDNSASASGGEGGAGGSASASLAANYHGVRNAPSIGLGAVYPTAGCQAGVGLGGSGTGGAGLINFTFSKRECETVVLAQNFAAIGMPDTSCDILKTTKAWQRAVKANPQIAASCEPRPAAPIVAAPAPAPVIVPDTSGFVRREELAERDRRLIEAMSEK